MHDREAEIRAACERGDPAGAVTLLLEGYGPELLGYLSATLQNRDQAREVYCVLAEDLWLGIEGFAWRCTARAWAYTLARNARSRYLLAEGRRAARARALEHLPWLRNLVARTRSPTPLHLRSEMKGRLREVRDGLAEDERTLLMLRVDRGMSWKELSVVLGESDGSEPETARAAARLRKRFQAIKDRLRPLVHDEAADGA